MSGRLVDYLTPKDAEHLNPAAWGGHAIGDNDATGYRSVPVTPGTVAMASRAIRAAHKALDSWRSPATGPTFMYYPGQAFPLTEFPGARIILDQEVLVTRGEEPFSVDPSRFVPHAAHRPTGYFAPKPLYAKSDHIHYLRQGAAAMTVKGEDGRPQWVVATSMESHVGVTEYYRQVGVLALPPVVRLGEVTHLEMQGGHEMLLRTNHAFVFPDGGPVVHVPAAPHVPQPAA